LRAQQMPPPPPRSTPWNLVRGRTWGPSLRPTHRGWTTFNRRAKLHPHAACARVQCGAASCRGEWLAAQPLHRCSPPPPPPVARAILHAALKNYDPSKDKRFNGTFRLPVPPRPVMSICVLGHEQHCTEAKAMVRGRRRAPCPPPSVPPRVLRGAARIVCPRALMRDPRGHSVVCCCGTHPRSSLPPHPAWPDRRRVLPSFRPPPLAAGHRRHVRRRPEEVQQEPQDGEEDGYVAWARCCEVPSFVPTIRLPRVCTRRPRFRRATQPLSAVH
jgi:hypothetical protein